MEISNRSRGILWMLISCFWAACMSGLVRHVANEGMNVFELVFYRSCVSLVLLLPWLIRSGGFRVLHTTRIKMYMLRAVMGLVAMYFWFYSLITIPLSNATALSFVAPLLTAVLAILILGERIGVHRVAALMTGFVGVLVVLRPGTDVFQHESLYTIVATLFWAFSGIIIKTLTNTDHPRVVVFYMVLMMAPFSFLFATPYLEMPTTEMMWWLLALGLTSNFFQIALSNAFAATEVTTILPFDFMRLVFVSILAYFAFGETLDVWTLAGAVIIMSGAVYAAYRETLHLKRQKAK